MFGSSELDEDSIKCFAKNDFYLAGNLSSLEEQIHTCTKLLEMLTCKAGIASEGCWHGLNMLSKHKREFLGLTSMDPLFPVKFAYLLDRAFQNFVLGLGDFHDRDCCPLLRARRIHKGQQVRDIDAAMLGFKTGSLSQLFLPRTLQSETSSKGDHPSKGGGSSKTWRTRQRGTPKGEKTDAEEFVPEDWWSKNPNPVAEWQTPNGKACTNFFDCNKASLKDDTLGWPRIASHDPGRKGSKLTYVWSTSASAQLLKQVREHTRGFWEAQCRKQEDHRQQNEGDPQLKPPGGCRTTIEGAGSGQTKGSGNPDGKKGNV
jgi:hypothetical protein